MTLSGRLSTFSLSDIFQVIDRGKKTGCLALKVSPSSPKYYRVWFEEGQIIAISSRSDNSDLLLLLKKHKWIDHQAITALNQLHSLSTPLGVYLENQGSLTPDNLRLSFHIQVIQQLCGLFRFSDGEFQFKVNTRAPKAEMTGLSISTAEATLIGFRSLKNWRLLESKLPKLESVLSKSPIAQLTLKLNPLEKKIWDLSNGTLPLEDIGKYVSHSSKDIQKAAFRLLITGLVVELPIEAALPMFNLRNNREKAISSTPNSAHIKAPEKNTRISSSFLQNLLVFLRSKS